MSAKLEREYFPAADNGPPKTKLSPPLPYTTRQIRRQGQSFRRVSFQRWVKGKVLRAIPSLFHVSYRPPLVHSLTATDHGMSPPTGTTSQTSFAASVSNKSTSASNKMTSTLTRAPPSIVNAAAFTTPSNPEPRETASRKRLAYADSKSSVKSYPR